MIDEHNDSDFGFACKLPCADSLLHSNINFDTIHESTCMIFFSRYASRYRPRLSKTVIKALAQGEVDNRN